LIHDGSRYGDLGVCVHFVETAQESASRRRRIDGVIHADALFGTPDVVAIVTGADIAAMDAVIDQIADVPDVIATDSKVARWLDGIGPPRPA
jgi:hypothetical protein